MFLVFLSSNRLGDDSTSKHRQHTREDLNPHDNVKSQLWKKTAGQNCGSHLTVTLVQKIAERIKSHVQPSLSVHVSTQLLKSFLNSNTGSGVYKVKLL